MKLVRAAAVTAGVADLGFAALFVLKPGAFHAEMEPKIYAQWVGLALLASAIVLFIVASDPARYLPILYVNAGIRALAALFTVIYITHFTLFIAMLPSHAGIVAILVAAAIYDLRLTGGGPAGKAAKKLLGGKKPDAAKKTSSRPEDGKVAGKSKNEGSA
jgi:fructose-specific phosphotransferase system IIC component